MNILFAAEKEKPEFWLPLLEKALPQDRFFAWPDTNGGDIDLALVATHPPGTFAGLKNLRLIQSLWMGVENIVADPELPVARLPLAPAGRLPALPAGLLGRAEDATGPAVHERVSVQAARTPGATARVEEAGGTDYATLDARAEALARRLAALGAGPETLVAVAVPRSAETLVALLGVWKAGAAYLPVDVDYPADRVRHMLADSGARLVVTTEESRLRLPAGTDAEPVLGTGRGALHHGRAPVVEHMSVQRMKAVPGSIAETDRHDCGPTRGESGSLGEPRGRIGRAAPGVAWIDQTR